MSMLGPDAFSGSATRILDIRWQHSGDIRVLDIRYPLQKRKNLLLELSIGRNGKFLGSPGSSNGYAPTNMTYKVTPQDHTSAIWKSRSKRRLVARFNRFYESRNTGKSILQCKILDQLCRKSSSNTETS
ncbi:hypothetical protein ACFX15_033996 [Malus domestica]